MRRVACGNCKSAPIRPALLRAGFIFQAHNLHESPTAVQNVTMGLQVHGRAEKPRYYIDAAEHLFALVGLADRTNHLPGSLSGGQNSGLLSPVRWSETRKFSLLMNRLQH